MLRPGMPKAFVSYIQCGCVYDIFVNIFTKYMWIRKKLINQSQVRPLILFSNVWCRGYLIYVKSLLFPQQPYKFNINFHETK